MRFGINLRGDLAKLSDAELAARLDSAWQTYQVTRNKPARWPVLWHSRRGPIRHPGAYRLFYVAGSVAAWTAGFLGAPANPGWKARMDGHLAICEIQDLTNEIERRMAARKAIA
jgi:hypothetical protein